MTEAPSLFDELVERIGAMDPEDKAALVKEANPGGQQRFVPLPGPQTEAYLSKADILLYGGEAGGGKGLNINELLPCPSGFIRMGDVKVGDILYDQDGNYTTVTGMSGINKRPCFEIEFDDGNVIVADDEHRWLTLDNKDRGQLLRFSEDWRASRRQKRPSRAVEHSQKPWVSKAVTTLNREREHTYRAPPSPSVRTTLEIYETLRVRGRANHSIELAGALDGPEVTLPIEPYLLGIWLGDGFSGGGEIGMLAEDWNALLGHIPRGQVSRRDCGKEGARPFEIIRFKGLQAALRKHGLLGNKHIPMEYLRASAEQRRELLRGLLDTDGSCDSQGKIELALSNKALADGACELICSLGIKARLSVKRLSEKNENWNDSHRMSFRCSFPAFKLARKLERQVFEGHRASVGRRFIVDVRKVLTVPTKCLSVDSPSKTYLVGRSFIPTHNTALLVGLASQEHKRGIIFRRELSQTDGLEEFGKEVIGESARFVASPAPEWTWENERALKLAGMQQAGDWMKHAGRERDFFGFDETGEFLVEQVASLLAWNRGPEGQRCRVVFGSNPPRSSDGYWLTEWFAPWLSPKFPKPALPGELRWAALIDAMPVWVDGPEEIEADGEMYRPLSFTFIPAGLKDNPHRNTADYRARLNSLPEPLRSQLLYGRWDVGTEDDAWQAIPTAWVVAAQDRWTETPPVGVPQCSLGVDVAQGGGDRTVIARRHDGWFAPLINVPGSETPGGTDVAALVLKHRKDRSTVAIDVGGGWGGDAYAHLKANIDAGNTTSFIRGYMGVKTTTLRTKDNIFGFKNVRSKAYWRLREALDPDQDGGSRMALPPSRQLLADLTAPTYDTRSGQIVLESKEAVVKRLKRSTDEGDAVIMSWDVGDKAESHAKIWQAGGHRGRGVKVVRTRPRGRRR